MSIYYEAGDVARAMQAHCPESSKRRSNTATYYEIAQVWCRDIQRCVWDFQEEDEDGITRLSTTGLQTVFTDHRYSMKGKRPRWFSWLEREFPYYEKIQQCDKGYKINGHSRLSRVNLIWSEEGLAGGTSDYEAHCDWLEEQSAEPDSRISFQAYNSDALAKFIDSCGRFLDDPTFKADIARAEATRRNLQLACRIRNITEQDDEYIFPAGSNGLTLAPLAMFRHVERDSAYGRTYHGGVNLQSAQKVLRKALLGPCWEIDIQSAVWRCYGLLADDLGIRRPPALSLMLTDRTGFRRRIAEDTMGDIPAMRHKKIEVVKEALTAIGFTAKISHDVYARPTALQDIIRNNEARDRFRSHKHVRELSDFIKELLNALKKHAGYSEMAEGLIGTIYDNKVNWPKFLAWLYQQTETKMRKAMTKAIEDSGRAVVLECHDGIYVLGGGTAMDLKLICEHALQRLWDIPNGQHFAEYPSVSVEKIPAFKARMTNAERKELVAEEARHKARIKKEEEDAHGYLDQRRQNGITFGGGSDITGPWTPGGDPTFAFRGDPGTDGMPWDIAARLEKLKAERQAAEQAERDAKRATMRHRGYDENGEPESPAVVLARIRAAQRSGGNEGAALACDKYQVGINEVPADLSEEI